MAIKRRALRSQQFIRESQKQRNALIISSLDKLASYYSEKDKEDRKDERYADATKLKIKMAKYDQATKMFPGLSLDNRFSGWEDNDIEGDGKLDSMVDYASDLMDSQNMGANWISRTGSISPYADEEMIFGLDETLQVSKEDFNVYRQWIFGEGEMATAQRWGGLINKKEDELTSAELNDMRDKGILKGDEIWDDVREDRKKVQDRFNNFKTGFMASDNGEKYFTDKEIRQFNTDALRESNLVSMTVQNYPDYKENSAILTTFDAGTVNKTVSLGYDDDNKHVGFKWRDASGKDFSVSDKDGNEAEAIRLVGDKGGYQLMVALTKPVEFLEKSVTAAGYRTDTDPVTGQPVQVSIFLENLYQQSPSVYDKVLAGLKAKERVDHFNNKIDISHIDIMAKRDQIKTSADISLLLADTLNDHIDEIFKTFGSDPSFSRKNFPTAEQFYGTQPWNTLMLKAKELNDRYTVEGNPLYHKGIAGFLGSLESSPGKRDGMNSFIQGIIEARAQDAQNREFFQLPSILDISNMIDMDYGNWDLNNGQYSYNGKPVETRNVLGGE